MRTIIFGPSDTAMPPRIATIAEGLAARGFDVIECNIPLGLTTADRVDMLAKPWKAGGLAVRLANRWLGLAAKARRLGRPDVVVVGYLGHFDVHLARLLYRRGKVPIVLDHLISAANTAKDRRLDGGMKTKGLRVVEAARRRAAGPGGRRRAPGPPRGRPERGADDRWRPRRGGDQAGRRGQHVGALARLGAR